MYSRLCLLHSMSCIHVRQCTARRDVLACSLEELRQCAVYLRHPENDVSIITKINKLSFAVLISYQECNKLFISKVQVICNVNVILCVFDSRLGHTIIFRSYSDPHISLSSPIKLPKIWQTYFYIILVHCCQEY